MTNPIDIKHLEQYVFGDRALLDEILTIFIEQAAMWVDRMDPAAPDADWHHAAHTLKGASRGVGAWALGDLAERAEHLVGPDQEASRRDLRLELKAAGELAIGYALHVREQAA